MMQDVKRNHLVPGSAAQLQRRDSLHQMSPCFVAYPRLDQPAHKRQGDHVVTVLRIRGKYTMSRNASSFEWLRQSHLARGCRDPFTYDIAGSIHGHTVPSARLVLRSTCHGMCSRESRPELVFLHLGFDGLLEEYFSTVLFHVSETVHDVRFKASRGRECFVTACSRQAQPSMHECLWRRLGRRWGLSRVYAGPSDDNMARRADELLNGVFVLPSSAGSVCR